MKILDLLKDVSIDVNATCSNKDEAIDTLVSLMAKQGNLNDQDVINTFVWMISELSKSVGITQRVRDVGAKEEDFEMLADKAMQDPCKPGNPREVSKEDFIELFRRAF